MCQRGTGSVFRFYKVKQEESCEGNRTLCRRTVYVYVRAQWQDHWHLPPRVAAFRTVLPKARTWLEHSTCHRFMGHARPWLPRAWNSALKRKPRCHVHETPRALTVHRSTSSLVVSMCNLKARLWPKKWSNVRARLRCEVENTAHAVCVPNNLQTATL